MTGVQTCALPISTASDGADTLEAMAEAARKLGWEYLGIADHSKAAAIANGLDEKRLLEQIKQAKYTFCGTQIIKKLPCMLKIQSQWHVVHILCISLQLFLVLHFFPGKSIAKVQYLNDVPFLK